MEIKELAMQEEAVRAALIECLKGRGGSQRVHDLKSRASTLREINDLEAEFGNKRNR